MVYYNFKVFVLNKSIYVSQPPFDICNTLCYHHVTNKETKSQNLSVFPKATLAGGVYVGVCSVTSDSLRPYVP